MKMKEKYYTPEIEEFHMGFEYEVFTKSIGTSVFDMSSEEPIEPIELTPVWTPQVFTMQTLNPLVAPYDFKTLLENGRIRVKYLDIEDIESLGWTTFNVGDERDCITVEKYFPSRGGRNRIRFQYGTAWDSYAHFIITDINDVPKVEEDAEFGVIIKNKSELIRLLKQLNIKP